MRAAIAATNVATKAEVTKVVHLVSTSRGRGNCTNVATGAQETRVEYLVSASLRFVPTGEAGADWSGAPGGASLHWHHQGVRQ